MSHEINNRLTSGAHLSDTPESGPAWLPQHGLLLSVVIPTYNESARLGPTLTRIDAYFSERAYRWELIIADDGSSDETVALAEEFAAGREHVHVLAAQHNQGKGAAVRRGVLAARGAYVLFSDADLSTPIEEIDLLLATLRNDHDIAIGSRALSTSNIVIAQPAHRRVMGSVFRSLTGRLARHGVRDSQCGFKAFRTAAARHIFGLLETDGFAFDIEVILLARQLGYCVSEIGVSWANNPDSTVSALRDPLRMLRDVWGMSGSISERLMHTVPGSRTGKTPGVALIHLVPPAPSSADSGTRVTAALEGAIRAADAVLAPGDSSESRRPTNEAVISLVGVKATEARMAGRRLAAAVTDALSIEGAGSATTFSVRMLPLATPVQSVEAEAERIVTRAKDSSPAILPGLRARAATLVTERQTLDGEVRIWNRRRITVRTSVVLNLIGLVWWLMWLLDFRHAANLPLYSLLVLAEAFSVAQVLGYWYTVWHDRRPERKTGRVAGQVDVFIPTYNEPIEVVERTLRAVQVMSYPHRTYLLDDGNRPEMGSLARRLNATWITRDNNRGAKAGNINHAISVTDGQFFAVFDADHAPHPDFLDRMMPYLEDAKVAFVQAPQYYWNRETNFVAGAAMDQQEIFFGPICRGKAGLNAVFCCGTNMVMRRESIESVGGMREDSIVEDAATSLDLHERGWQSRYVPDRLAEGLAPEDLSAYLSQQRRWARGNIEILLKGRLLRRRMPLSLRFQYLWSAMYYLTGLSAMVYLALPILFLLFGVQTVSAGAGDFIAHFLPYILLTIFILARSAEGRLRFRAIQVSYGLFPVFLGALWSVVTRRSGGFHVTPKVGSRQSFYHLIIPQLIVIAVSLVAIIIGFVHFGGARTVTNASWTAFNIILLSAMVRAAQPQATSGSIAATDDLAAAAADDESAA